MQEPTRRLALLSLLAAGAALQGCGPNEQAQAAELQRWLQARVLDRQGLAVPRPTPEERSAFGRFAADYDVILAFHDRMNESVTGKLGEVIRRGSFNRAQDFMDRKGDIAAAREGMRRMSEAMDGALKEAIDRKNALKQPDALKAVYDQAFDRIVTNPASVVREVFPVADSIFAQGLEFADFLTANKADFKFNGPIVETSKQNLLTDFNRRAQGLAQSGNGLLEAQRKMQALMRGQ